MCNVKCLFNYILVIVLCGLLVQTCGLQLSEGDIMALDHYNYRNPNKKSEHFFGFPKAEPDASQCTDNVYICEIPSQVADMTLNTTKICDFRNDRFESQVFRWMAGFGCFVFVPPNILVDGVITLSIKRCFYENFGGLAHCVELPNPDGTCSCFPFDVHIPRARDAIVAQFTPAFRDRWPNCARNAEQCCNEVMGIVEEFPEDQCPATWDGWTCWPPAPAGTVAQEICSEFAYTTTRPSCHHFSHKTCHADGTWEQDTHYGSCSITPRLVQRNQFYMAVLGASAILSAPAVIIMIVYKRLRITRVALHRNLLIAIIVKNILVIVSRNEVYIAELTSTEDTVMSRNGWPCRLLAVSERFAASMVFMCMLVEAIYLHRLIAAVFRKEINVPLLYALGTLACVVPVLAWSIVMATLNDTNCWVVYTVDHIQWILDAPRIAMLLVNTGLLIDIIRVLVTNFSRRESGTQLSTAKATLFLMPIFGVQILLTVYRPSLASCAWEQTYFFFTYSMEALQGIMVAIFYCYANKEVRGLLKLTYKKTENVITNQIRRTSNFRRITLPSSSRKTFSTILDNNLAPMPEEQDQAEFKNVQVTDLDDYYANNNNIMEDTQPRRRSIKVDAITVGIANKSFTLDPEDDVNSNFYNEANMDTDSVNSQSPRGQPIYCSVNKHNNNDASTNNETTSAASDTVEYYEWLKCASPTSSLYDNSLDEYEIKYLDQKIKSDKQPNINNNNNPSAAEPPPAPARNLKVPQKNDEENVSFSDFHIPENIVESLDGKEIFEEVKRRSDCSMQAADEFQDDVAIDAAAMFPNRDPKDKIVFINP